MSVRLTMTFIGVAALAVALPSAAGRSRGEPLL
jgi:hypothetical protein